MAELGTRERNLKDGRVSHISVWPLTENKTKQQPKQLASSHGRSVTTLLDIRGKLESGLPSTPKSFGLERRRVRTKVAPPLFHHSFMLNKRPSNSLVAVTHTFNPSTKETEAGGSLYALDQPRLQREFQGYTENPVSKNQTKQTDKAIIQLGRH